MTDKEKQLCDILNQYCFDWVWNEPTSEYRENIHPLLLDKKSHIGNIYYKDEILPLPDVYTGSYFVYGLFNSSLCYNLTIPTDKWIACDVLCNDYNVLFDIYSKKGYMLNKKYTFIYINKAKTVIFLAVYKDMTKKMMTVSEMNQLCFCVYYDSDVLNDCHVYSYKVPSTDLDSSYRSAIQSNIATLNNSSSLNKMIIYINGVETTSLAPTLALNDYIDIILDENISFSFDLDLSLTDNDFSYYSEKDNTYKQIVHIPKTLNTNNKVITHNTCDIWVRKKSPTTRAVEGLYMQRTSDRGVTQITHNDFSIPTFILDAYRDYLGTQDITLHVVCRIHDKDNVLVRDASYINMLYGLSDAEIYKILKGNDLSSLVSFWKANALEASTYTNMFFDLADLYSKNIDYYVDSLGYYHTLEIIASRINTRTITDVSNRYISLEKPGLYKGYQCFPIVYKNGLKIAYSLIEYSNTDDIINVTIKNECTLSVGDKITVVLYLDQDRSIYRVNPTNTNKYININYSDFKIYQEISNAANTYQGVDVSSNTIYKDVTDVYGLYSITALTTGGVQVGFGEQMYDNAYIICNTQCSYAWGIDISDLVLNGNNLVVPITKKVDSNDDIVPILYFNNISVYLNGHYLIRDLDFIVNPIKDNEENISFHQIVIQTMEYLVEPGTNFVEVLLNTNEIEDKSVGFQLDNMCTDETPAGLWFPYVSLFHINGKLETEIVDNGVYISTPTDKYRQGAPYEVQTSVPAIIKDFISNYHTNTDKQRLIDINSYLGTIRPVISDKVVLPQSHRIYSTFINTILRDIIYNNKRLANDPDPIKAADQTEEYDYLKPLDIVQINKNDTAYVDYYPAYRRYVVPDDILLLCRTVVKLNMPTETIRAKVDTEL